jgi:CRISPR/Cas system-associated protein Cas7 (RAMP superfamily)
MVISYPVCCQFAVHTKRQSSVKYLHQGDSVSGVRELSTRDLWHWSDIIIEDFVLNTAHYVTISQSQSNALPPSRAGKLL